jgi:predicted TIM-barrel fold metal-dependent hydrolase
MSERSERGPSGPLSGQGQSELPYRAFDGDNHYYEALDAFTRHLDPKWGPRTVEWAEINGRRYHVVGGRVSHAVVNPTFDPVAKPGVLSGYFRGNPEGKRPQDYLAARERIQECYRDRDARLAVMDEQGLEAVWMFPTLGVLYEELLKHDPEAVGVLFRAFNLWLDDDWGLHHEDRIFGIPYIPMASVDMAVRELEWALARGARAVVVPPRVPTTANGPVPASRPYFDPFWARANEAGITVVVHAGDDGYTKHGYAREGFSAAFDGPVNPIGFVMRERSIEDYLASLICDRLFDRFPNLRVASVENGSIFLGLLFRKLRSIHVKFPGYFGEDPVETFKRHVWINPFWEDDVQEVVALMGADRVIFGSDWPHIEGMPQPLDYVVELKEFDDDTQRLILRDNVAFLNELRPA